ncbi:capsular polysaccharide synthesis protein [Acinetobacter pittii]|uniref:capsular polysaccharide synthesis protein n=1 Tax=Acinetobacter pittii TaxID=48296 RepID=UPI003AF52080
MIDKQLNGVQLDIQNDNIINIFSTDEKQTQLLKKWHKQPWRTFYSLFTSKEKRKKQKYQANLLQKKHVAKLWNIFFKKYFDGELEYFNLQPKKIFKNQKIIWQYWGQGLEAAQQNEIVKLCFASVDRYKGDYQVIRLDEESVKEYLELPDFIWEKKNNVQFKPAFFADLIRLALLDVYGGIWIDATILLTEEINLLILDQDFFMFHRHDNAENKKFWINFNNDYFGWHDEHFVNVLNSFIVSKKNNEITHICLDIMLNYWKTQNNIPHYFIFQIMFNELMREYLSHSSMIILDDTLLHLLQVKQSKVFDMKDYNEILSKISIHKLNYIKELQPSSYNEYLLKEYSLL